MLIVGAKGFAKEILEVSWQLGLSEDVAFFDDLSTDLPKMLYDRFVVLRSDVEVKNWFEATESRSYVLGLGNPIARRKLSSRIDQLGGSLESLCSPFARIGHFGNSIGRGSNIMTGSVLTSGITIGVGVLVNLNCTIGHDCVIGDFVELSPGTHISGNCKIGNYCVFGTNSTLLPKIVIGDNVIVGAGAVVTQNVESNSVIVGVPGKVVKRIPALEF